jgi:hypothetical protein
MICYERQSFVRSHLTDHLAEEKNQEGRHGVGSEEEHVVGRHEHERTLRVCSVRERVCVLDSVHVHGTTCVECVRVS